MMKMKLLAGNSLLFILPRTEPNAASVGGCVADENQAPIAGAAVFDPRRILEPGGCNKQRSNWLLQPDGNKTGPLLGIREGGTLRIGVGCSILFFLRGSTGNWISYSLASGSTNIGSLRLKGALDR